MHPNYQTLIQFACLFLAYQMSSSSSPYLNLLTIYHKLFCLLFLGSVCMNDSVNESAQNDNNPGNIKRSEERRVGKECRYRWWREHQKTKRTIEEKTVYVS